MLLIGEYAYKIKKPVRLPYLDFSTRQIRQHYCNEELQLNSRLAPQLYLQVVALYGSERQPSFHAQGKPIDYAVRLRQFPAEDQLDELMGSGKLTAHLVDDCVDYIYGYYSESPSIRERDVGDPCEDIKVLYGKLEQYVELLTQN